MSILIRRYSAGDAPAWDDVVARSRNGTAFHTRRFLSYHPDDRFVDHSLLLLEGSVIRGVLPAAEKDGRLVSHPGASYGGLAVDASASAAECGEMLDAVLAYARDRFSGVSMLRLPPASLQRTFAEDEHYWLFRKGFALTKCELDGAVRLDVPTADGVLARLDGKCRNMVRQAERAGITVEWSDDFAAFWPILSGVLEGRHGAKPTHTLGEILRLRELLGEDVRLLAAYKDGAMIGGIVLVTIHDRALYTLYMAQEYAQQRHHPMHALLHAALRACVDEKRDVLHVGVSTEEGGTVLNEGLLFFKESFGASPVRRETWEISF